MFKRKTACTLAILLLLTTLFTFSFTGCGNKKSSIKDLKEIQVSMTTDKGEVVLLLRPDLMPVTVENFVGLVEKKFYDGLVFHRVEDWVIQTGDPTATGSGGSDKTIKLETHAELKNVKYAVGMARSTDPNSATSQFYILRKDASSLDGKYAIFGNVIKGQEVVDKITKNDKVKEIKILSKK